MITHAFFQPKFHKYFTEFAKASMRVLFQTVQGFVKVKNIPILPFPEQLIQVIAPYTLLLGDHNEEMYC